MRALLLIRQLLIRPSRDYAMPFQMQLRARHGRHFEDRRRSSSGSLRNRRRSSGHIVMITGEIPKFRFHGEALLLAESRGIIANTADFDLLPSLLREGDEERRHEVEKRGKIFLPRTAAHMTARRRRASLHEVTSASRRRRERRRRSSRDHRS